VGGAIVIRAALPRGQVRWPAHGVRGVHGLFHSFAHTTEAITMLTGDFGTRWVTDTLAFKPYPCGTMAQLYRLRAPAGRARKPEDVAERLQVARDAHRL
jgi:hypothetical protein